MENILYLWKIMKKEQFGYYKVEDVLEYGIVKAVIIGKIDWWCEYHKKNDNKQSDGNYWSGHLSYGDLCKQTGLPYKTVRNNMQELIRDNIIQRGNFNKLTYDATGWYRRVPVEGTGGTRNGYREYPEKVGGVPGKGATIPDITSNIIPDIISDIKIENNIDIDTGANNTWRQFINAENDYLKENMLNYIRRIATNKKPNNKNAVVQYN